MKRHYLIPGNPVPLPRQRFTKTGRSYKPSKYLNVAHAHRVLLKGAHLGPPIEGPVKVIVDFYHSRPQRLKRKKDPAHSMRKPNRPDIDNLVKHVFDCMNDIVFVDDAQVVYLSASDNYCPKGEQPHTTITITEVGNA